MVATYGTMISTLLPRYKNKLYIWRIKKLNHPKEDNMKIKYANELIINMELGGTITCVYQLIFDENGSNDTQIIQYLILNGLGL